MLHFVGEIQKLDFCLNALQLLYVGLRGDANRPPGEGRFDQHLDLTDITHEILIYRPYRCLMSSSVRQPGRRAIR
jgi:hypothetical protein